MADSAVDFLLENMIQLINSDNELVLEAYEEKVVIGKEQIEWLYEEMQFLQKFLKDSDQKKRDEHEELKSFVARIRDVTYKAEDIIDWFLLKAVLQLRDRSTGCDFVHEAQQICRSLSENLSEPAPSVEKFMSEVLEILSWLHSHMAYKIGDGFRETIQEIKPIVKQAINLREKGSSLRWLDSNAFDVADWLDSDEINACLHQLCREKFCDVDFLLNTSSKEIPDRFACIIEEIKIIMKDVMVIHEKRTGELNDKTDTLCHLAVEKIQQVDQLLNSSSKEIRDAFGVVIKEIKSIIEVIRLQECHRQLAIRLSKANLCEVDCPDNVYSMFIPYKEMVRLAEKILQSFGTIAEEIYEKGLGVPWINSQMTREFLHLLSLSLKLVDLAKNIPRRFAFVIEKTNSIMTEVMKIYQNGFRSSWLESVMGDEIHKWFATVTAEIKSIKREVMKIYETKMYGIGVLRVEKSSRGASSIRTTFRVKEELIVGFADETTKLMELLLEEHEMQLKVIPIIGMPGLGKTTLAIQVYNNPLIVYQFHFRAWTLVSQVYWRRDLLLSILNSADIQLKGETEKMRDEALGEGLYRSLKGKKYLIVMDDIWEFRVWDDIKRYFPNDNNGSRVIFTSRHADVALALHAEPHYLRFLNSDESWDLLRQKVFRGGSCPRELIEIGKKIAKKCQGLPLAIIVIAGLLSKEDKKQDSWRHVAESVSSYIATEPEQFMDTLALSYNHLPYHLKPCFLYFGAFPEDYDIPVWKLIWLWIAEGFIVRNQQKSLEEVAEDYMMDLINRSLVVVSKKSSNGGIKACRIHDLLRDLCLKKAREENFMHVSKYEPTSSSLSSPMAKRQRRICISTHIDFFTIRTHLNGCGYSKHGDPEVRSFSSTAVLTLSSLISFSGAFKLLRVLNISSVKISSFPEELQLLIHLRYLSCHVGKEYFQPSISNLWKLETFIDEGAQKGCISFSDDIWKMVKLRHLYTKRFIEIPHVPNNDYPFMLDDLQTICNLNLCGGDEQVLRWIPNLKKLTCSFVDSRDSNDIFPKLNFLVHLETLNISYGGCKRDLGRFPCLNEFPPNLKSLTLSNFRLSWEEMSTLGRLPNLEVLKSKYNAFEGPSWDTSDGLFRKLKFLKFQYLDIKKWNASSSQFPILQTLVLDTCEQLEEIPSGLHESFTLEMIRLRFCSSSTAHSALQIQKWQRSMGYDGLKIHIYPWKNEYNDEDEDDAQVMGCFSTLCRLLFQFIFSKFSRGREIPFPLA